MKNKELFDKTIGILVKAYFEGTLHHGNCAVCAVGNLIADSKGYDIKTDSQSDYGWFECDKEILPEWGLIFQTTSSGAAFYPNLITHEMRVEIIDTGYLIYELRKIEYAFESVPYKEYNSDQHQFDGLMSVVDTLQEIHGCTDEEKEEAKLKFVKA